jgi:hypothetical protein
MDTPGSASERARRWRPIDNRVIHSASLWRRTQEVARKGVGHLPDSGGRWRHRYIVWAVVEGLACCVVWAAVEALASLNGEDVGIVWYLRLIGAFEHRILIAAKFFSRANRQCLCGSRRSGRKYFTKRDAGACIIRLPLL